MIRFSLFFIVLFTITSCNNEDNIVEVVLDESIIPEDAVDVSLRPTFGFNSLYGGLRTTYKIYCDTITPPQNEVASSSGSIFHIMCDESVLLKPNTEYYWYCKAEKDEAVFPTDIYAFTTIDTSILNENRWRCQYVLNESDYEQQNPQDYYSYDLPADSCFIYSEPYAFTISDDSVENVYRYGVDGVLPSTGNYSFSFDTLNILEWGYRFINLGTNYYNSNDNNANKIVFVLQKQNSNNIIVFSKGD